jgi:hypothetical protein
MRTAVFLFFAILYTRFISSESSEGGKMEKSGVKKSAKGCGK